MKRFLSRGGLIACCLLLVGCGFPRGAGFEREVLASALDETGQMQQDFAVEPVTRDALTRYLQWPLTGDAPMRWINRQPQAANRIIAAGDKVAVTVWSTEDNSLLTAQGQRSVRLEEITVSSSGEIFLPYIENTRISGMSTDHAREVIQARFVEVIPSAQVQLELVEGRQSTVNMVSGVTEPGAYPLLDQDYTVLALLAASGGVQNGMNNPQIRLIRDDAIYGTSLERLFSEPALDTTLLVRYRWRLLPAITHVWVDSPASRDGGRAQWAIPKQLAEFRQERERHHQTTMIAQRDGDALGGMIVLDRNC